jgi:hypothetical protein
MTQRRITRQIYLTLAVMWQDGILGAGGLSIGGFMWCSDSGHFCQKCHSQWTRHCHQSVFLGDHVYSEWTRCQWEGDWTSRHTQVKVTRWHLSSLPDMPQPVDTKLSQSVFLGEGEGMWLEYCHSYLSQRERSISCNFSFIYLSLDHIFYFPA